MLISDLCPMDLLIQRIGRLHRHECHRPQKLIVPICYITEGDGSEEVYGKYLLERTRQLLPDTIRLPDDIVQLVNAAYDGSDALGKGEYDLKIACKQSRADVFRILEPNRGRPSIVGLLEHAVSDSNKVAEASVRDGEDAVEVHTCNCFLCFTNSVCVL